MNRTKDGNIRSTRGNKTTVRRISEVKRQRLLNSRVRALKWLCIRCLQNKVVYLKCQHSIYDSVEELILKKCSFFSRINVPVP